MQQSIPIICKFNMRCRLYLYVEEITNDYSVETENIFVKFFLCYSFRKLTFLL